jgi:TRAP-type C4-dicarboxylate transport system permease small subunit
VLVIVLAATVTLEVVVRYVLQVPLAWTEEAARFILVWLGMLSTVLAARSGRHFSLQWLRQVLPRTVGLWLQVGIDLFITGFAFLLVIESAIYLEVVANQQSVAMQIDMRVPSAAVTVTAVLLFMTYAARVVSCLCELAGVAAT